MLEEVLTQESGLARDKHPHLSLHLRESHKMGDRICRNRLLSGYPRRPLDPPSSIIRHGTINPTAAQNATPTRPCAAVFASGGMAEASRQKISGQRRPCNSASGVRLGYGALREVRTGRKHEVA
jgi:hypothetical protein